MNLLREYIREMLKERLGEKVFATDAPEGHPHHGTEPNTALEQALYDALYKYLIEENPENLTAEQIELIIQYAKDPRYDDVIKLDNRNIKIYRGQIVSKERLEYLIGDDLPPPGKEYETNVELEYHPQNFHRQGIVSSWTTDQSKAEHFAMGYNTRGIKDPVRVVFISNITFGTFLDISPLYAYHGFKPHGDESETLALKPGFFVLSLYLMHPEQKRVGSS